MSRIKILAESFRSIPLSIAGRTLRPVTAGTINLLMISGNPLFADAKPGDDKEGQEMDGLFQFIYIHTAPVDEVLDVIDDRALLARKARAISLEFGLDDLMDFSKQFSAVQTRLSAGLVEIIPEKGEKLGKRATKPARTGSPSSSSTSEEQETPPESNGSSGSSPSTEPSNISTQPTPQTDSAPVGRSRIWEDTPESNPEEPSNVIPLP